MYGHACMHVHIYLWDMWVRVCARAWVHMHMPVPTHAHVHVPVPVSLDVHVHVPAHVPKGLLPKGNGKDAIPMAMSGQPPNLTPENPAPGAGSGAGSIPVQTCCPARGNG